MDWRRKKFTFVVIPDANRSVIRFQMSALVIVIGIALIVALAAGAVAGFLLYRGNHGEIGQLKSKLSDATGQYERIIQGKDDHINELQTQIVGLSDQAASINDHMSDIKDLESELKEMVGIKDGDSAKSAAADEDNAEEEAMDGTGGEALPVTDEEMNALISQTRSVFAELEQRAELLKPELEDTKSTVLRMTAILRVTPTIWPTDSRRLTSSFGVRKDPFTKRATFHAGLDIGGANGDSVYATADGVVASADYLTKSHGNNIWISHGNGIRTHYSHLSKMLVKPGDKVKKGDVIARMGSSGRSTGPHLHYEVSVGGNNVDPKPYLKASRKEN